MGLLVERKIRVRCSEQAPEAVNLGGRWLRVTGVLDVWKDVGCWWQGEREKVFYRIEIAGGGVLEVYRALGADDWILYRVYD